MIDADVVIAYCIFYLKTVTLAQLNLLRKATMFLDLDKYSIDSAVFLQKHLFQWIAEDTIGTPLDKSDTFDHIEHVDNIFGSRILPKQRKELKNAILSVLCSSKNQQKANNVDIVRPSWKDCMLGIAYLVSTRSHDAQTQCGAVICNTDNEIVSTGYNGFIRNIDNTALPNTRPDKYDFMIHAEHNAILNCVRQGKSTKNTIIYVTAKPCLACLQYIWQAGIIKVIHIPSVTNMQLSKASQEKTDLILQLTGLDIEEYTPQPLTKNIENLGVFFEQLLARIV